MVKIENLDPTRYRKRRDLVFVCRPEGFANPATALGVPKWSSAGIAAGLLTATATTLLGGRPLSTSPSRNHNEPRDDDHIGLLGADPVP